jgi:hypothetical protein
MYRRRDLVAYVGEGGRVGLIALFPTHFSPKPEKIEAPQALIVALENGQLAADGIRVGGTGARETIPSSEWANALISGDHLSWASKGSTVAARWHDITLDRAAVERHLRSRPEVAARTKFDWGILRKMHNEIRARHPEFSQNELMLELQGAYRDRLNKEPPSRTTLQRQIGRWS